jgi:hypothetical protein
LFCGFHGSGGFQKNFENQRRKKMKNYQRLYYKNYYAQNEKGEYIPVSRKVCFAPAEPPTEENPYKQRWFYDPEAGYVVRLERSKHGEEFYRTNDTSLKREERYRNRKFACIWKGTSNCDQNCIECNEKNTCRTVELDKTWTSENSDEMKSIFDPIDETQNITEMLENKEITTIILAAYKNLSNEDQLLFNCLIEKKAKQEIAKLLNLKSVDGVRYRELQLRKKLLLNKDLKEFLEK